MRVLIVGGVAGGMSCATRLRRLEGDAEIIVFEKSGHVSYANCGLPYYVGGVIEERSSLLLQTPESLHQRFRIDVRVHHEVVAVDAKAKRVTAVNHDTGETSSVDYDVLVLSPGASPIIPPIPGIARALPLRNVEDVERMSLAVALTPRHAVVIGGGFIGVEVAENLRHRGIDTSIVDVAAQVLDPLDPEMAQLAAEELENNGIRLHLGAAVVAVHEGTVELDSGERLAADLVVVAIGMRPETGLARDAGLTIGPRGGIAVDDFNRTSDHSIYAVGDAVEKFDALDGRSTLVPLANIANRQGRVVADHIAGRPVRPLPAIGTVIVKVFGLTVATTGWNEKRLVAAGRAPVVIHAHPGSHAAYYPGAKDMALKLLVDPSDGSILGAQGVGPEGVDKRIDVLATAIRGGITAPELADLELAYAPPFSSAKDPVNMLGYIAENVLTGLVRTVQWSEVETMQSAGAQVVDVRTAQEFAGGSIPGAVNIPLDELRERLDEFRTDQVIVTCQVGKRGHTAVTLLSELGVEASNLDGGYETWRNSPSAKKLHPVG
jgi:NADPH-dependent 2,4-dienoyl-CoA reductase/sulfur reductase-like enzyme/rhodanese-related sulfurtransferase